MNKPLSMIINDTKKKIVDTCNESQLPISILDSIIQNIYMEIHLVAEKQVAEDEYFYNKKLEETELDAKTE